MANNGKKTTTADGAKNGSPFRSGTEDLVPAKEPVKEQDAPAVEPTPETPKAPKESALDRLKKKNENSATKTVMDKFERMNLFDSTKANEVKTKGTSSLGTVQLEKGGMMISGRNVGAEQNEPEWTKEQTAYIEEMVTTKLEIMDVRDSRRSIADSAQKYVGRDEKGTIMPTEAGYISNLHPSEYCVGIGPFKFDTTGSPRHYSDAVVAGIKGDWLLNQWTSEWVVIEGVAPDVFTRQNRVGSATQSNRRIGVNFARIGLPKLAFGPLFNSLSAQYPDIMASIIETPGYYWMNASWGVSSFSATFMYRNNDGEIKRTSNLPDVMKMLGGKSSLALATVAISITCGSKTEGQKPVPDKASYGLSVKIHNAFGINVVDYHGPPQQGSTGMMIPARFINQAQSMTGSAGGAGPLGIFANTGTKGNLFGSGSAPAPSVMSGDSESFLGD